MTTGSFNFPDGSTRFFKNGEMHLEGDLPVIINMVDETQMWHKGETHLERDLPAIIMAVRTQLWYKNGEMQ